METHRINILGASGCGASTLGRSVAASLSLPHFDCDDYYHEPSDPLFTRPRAPQARHDLLMADLGRLPGWVLSGGVAGWDPSPRLDFTLMVFLWVPAEVRLERLRRRERARFKERVLPGGDMHEAHEAFIQWAARYDIGDIEGKTLARHETYLAAQTCPVLQIRGTMNTAGMTSAIILALDR